MTSQATWGTGRVYISTFCRPNREPIASSSKSHIRYCRDCKDGTFSTGARDQCHPCSEHPDRINDKPSDTSSYWVSGKTCVYACRSGFFGALCEVCSAYQSRLGNAAPAHARWIDGKSVCEWECSPEFPRNGSRCEQTLPPGKSAHVVAGNATASEIRISWTEPPKDTRVISNGSD